MSLKCSHPECQETEIEKLLTVRLHLYREGYDAPAEVYLRLPFCANHKPDPGALEFFMRTNWEQICVGFERNNLVRPVLDRTEYAFVPFQEYIDFAQAQKLEGDVSVQWKN